MDDELRKRALALYKPPFRFEHGYFWDSETEMVADKRDRPETPADVFLRRNEMARLRGWGRIQYLPEPEKLQDAVGELIAEALTEYWTRQSKLASITYKCPQCNKIFYSETPNADAIGMMSSARMELPEMCRKCDAQEQYREKCAAVANSKKEKAISHEAEVAEVVKIVTGKLKDPTVYVETAEKDGKPATHIYIRGAAGTINNEVALPGSVGARFEYFLFHGSSAEELAAFKRIATNAFTQKDPYDKTGK